MLSEISHRRAGLGSSADYTDYHRYASRRIKKSRHRENLSVRSTKTYEPKPLTNTPIQSSLLALLSERCWAAAMSARAALEADAAAAPSSSSRGTINSKLAKAVKYSEKLASLAGEKLDLHTYVALLSGEAALEKQHWHKVAIHFSKVRLGIYALNSKSASADDVLTDLLTTVIDPALRLALAQQKEDYAGESNAKASEIVHKHAPTFLELVRAVNADVLDLDTAVKQVNKITFRNYTAKVRYDSLAKILLTVQEKDAQLKSLDDPASFDDLLSSWDQLSNTTHDIASEISQAGQPREQDLDIIATYAQFHLLNRRIQRDRTVASREVGKTNAVRLYDVLVQSSESMAELPGVNNDDESLSGIQSMKTYFQIQRISASASLRPKGSLEALALINLAYKNAEEHAADLEDYASLSLDLPVTSNDYKQSSKNTKTQLVKTHALTLIYQEVQNRSAVQSSLASNSDFLQGVPAGSTLVIADYTGKQLDAVPVKPVFYDIAYNYLGAGNAEPDQDAMDVSNEPQGQSKKGLFGLFK